MDTSQGRRRKKRWPEALKREIVAATLVIGASVSVVARQYDVNANQVFMWCRRYREALEGAAALPTSAPVLDVLSRIAAHPASRIDELLPWNWRPNGEAVGQAA